MLFVVIESHDDMSTLFSLHEKRGVLGFRFGYGLIDVHHGFLAKNLRNCIGSFLHCSADHDIGHVHFLQRRQKEFV